MLTYVDLYCVGTFLFLAFTRIIVGAAAIVNPTLIAHEYAEFSDYCDYATKPFTYLTGASQIALGFTTLALIHIIERTCQRCITHYAFAAEIAIELAYLGVAIQFQRTDELISAPVILVHNLFLWKLVATHRIYSDHYVQM